MRQILSGVYHWTSFHEGIAQRVHSYFVEAVTPAFLIDARMVDKGLDWFNGHAAPANLYLTNRHHYRHAQDFVKAFGCTVWCHENGLHEFSHGENVRGFRDGDVLPGSVKALNVGSLCAEETAFYIPIHGGILAIGDAVVRSGTHLDFVPDELMGDDPAAVKSGLKRAFHHILANYPVEHVLMAHGQPIVEDGKRDLERFLAA